MMMQNTCISPDRIILHRIGIKLHSLFQTLRQLGSIYFLSRFFLSVCSSSLTVSICFPLISSILVTILLFIFLGIPHEFPLWMEKDLGVVSLAKRKVFHPMTFCVSALLIQGVMSECDDDTRTNT